MRHLDLFSGIGGFALAARWVGWETIGFCEIDPYCQKVLRKHFDAPIHGDIKTYEPPTGPVDVISAGWPCQPVSQIGERKGNEDHRALWPDTLRIINAVRPSWFVGENVIGLETMGLADVLADLDRAGYQSQAFDIPAAGVGARHERRRFFIVANSDREGLQGFDSAGLSEWYSAERHLGPGDCWYATPRVCRGADGLSDRVDRLKGLGNAIVPQVAEVIFHAISAVSNDSD